MAQKTPARVRIAAPASLVADLAPPGYTVELLITRSGRTALPGDEGALPALVDQPFDADEIASLRATVAAYESGRKTPAEPTA